MIALPFVTLSTWLNVYEYSIILLFFLSWILTPNFVYIQKFSILLDKILLYLYVVNIFRSYQIKYMHGLFVITFETCMNFQIKIDKCTWTPKCCVTLSFFSSISWSNKFRVDFVIVRYVSQIFWYYLVIQIYYSIFSSLKFDDIFTIVLMHEIWNDKLGMTAYLFI